MKQFLGEDFLLSNEVSIKLYEDYAKDMPIIDYHCHISPEQIAKNQKFKNITEVWLYGDHYKWRAMRSNGIEEQYITGDASDYDKFYAFATTLERAIGNPLYHWSHLELKRYFGYEGTLSRKTAPEVWELCNKKLETLSVLDMIEQAKVYMIGTTDDPIDDLKYHKEIAENDAISVKVYPSFRPDKAMNINLPTFISYVASLGKVADMEITTFVQMKEALAKRMDHFGDMGCKISDHALDYVLYVPATDEEIDAILAKGLAGEALTATEIGQYKTAYMLFVASEYAKRNWTMQLHYGCKRDNNTDMFDKIGPDTGFDCINNFAPSAQLADFLNALQKTCSLPKTIIYSLNPNDDTAIGTIIGCFQENSSVAGKIQHGSAWWFNDTKTGMIAQMTSLANLGLLGNFVGMLTDSRSFLSYTRHEYFRRILCELIGTWVNEGEFPYDEQLLETIIKGISFENAKSYFNV
ncbi:MAG: glucuronate isomerase [Lachnospiraceae bacterium]